MHRKRPSSCCRSGTRHCHVECRIDDRRRSGKLAGAKWPKMSKFLLAVFVGFGLVANANAASVDWCSRQSIASLPKSTDHGTWQEHKFKAHHGWSEITWSNHRLPTRVLCFVHDGKQARSAQQCYGLGAHNCLQDGVRRRVTVWPGGEFVSLIFSSDRSGEFDSVTVYSDASPVYGSLRRAHHRARSPTSG